MNCFIHDRSVAVGLCAVCQRAVCRECVGRDAPRVVCRNCLQSRAILGFEYRSQASMGNWPLVHICMGVDPATMRPRIAKGFLAIGNIAVGFITLGGASFGLAVALGGAAVGLGLSVGGLAIGSVALGGAAIGFVYAIGGGAFGPAIIDGRRCDPAALEFVRQWFGTSILPPNCR